MHHTRTTATAVLLVASIATCVQAYVGPNDPCPLPTPYPPPEAGAGVALNPGMEGGFTNGGANQWVAWKNPRFTVQVHYQDAGHKYSGNYSQRLDLPRPEEDLQAAGLYQQIWVVPGGVYTATAKIYLTCSNCEVDDIFATIGLDNFGQPNGEGSGMTWSNEIYTRGQWLTATVSVTAAAPVMTLTLRGTRKWVHGDGASFWFDEVTFSGPIPTGERPGPEPDPVDPETLIPATTGPNLVTNPSFEEPFTNGVCAGWNAWSTAGTGTWRQSTRLGKVGAGKYGGGCDFEMAQMYSKTVLLMGSEPLQGNGTYGTADGQYIFPQMDNAIYIGRPYIDDFYSQYQTNPTFYGAQLADKMHQHQLDHPRIDAWQGLNEPDWGWGWQWVVQFEKAYAERLHYWGMKSCSLNLSTGSPGNIWRVVDETYDPSGHDLMDIADYLGHHCYGGPDVQLMVSTQGPGLSSPCDFALRPRKFWDMYNRRGWRLPPVIATEGSTYFGWHDAIAPETIGADLVAMGGYMNATRWWCGYTNFTCGAYGSGLWEQWEIIGQDDIVANVANWNYNHPCDAADAYYSQMFGAGKVHPYNVSDMTPAGYFNGGVNQQLTGLIAGQTYVVKAWIKWEFRGHQPTQIKFYLGVDPTGQTANPAAPSIDWGTDQLAAKAPVHEIFSHAWRTFTPTASTASLWLRADHALSDPSFMFYVDLVEVRQGESIIPTPAIQLSTSQITASTVAGTNPATGSFTVRNAGTGTLNYAISDNAAWLAATPTSGTSTGEADTVLVVYDAASLTAGTYNAAIAVSDPNAPNSPLAVSVTLTVNATPPPPSDAIANGGFEGGVQGSGVGASWFSFKSSGYGATFSVVADVVHGGSKSQRVDNPEPPDTDYYAGVYQTITTTPGVGYTITAWNRTSLPGGGQWDLIARLGIDLTGGNNFQAGSVTWYEFNSAKNTWVTLSRHVTATSSSMTIFLEAWRKWTSGGGGFAWFDDVSAMPDTPPPQPAMTVSPLSLSPTTRAGGSPNSQSFTVRNSGTGTLSYSITPGATWLSVLPPSGTSTGETDTIAVNYSTASLPAGNYQAPISIADTAASNSPQTIIVSLTVQSATLRCDFDGDTDVDQSDFGHFQTCLTGDDVPQDDPACANAKLDGDTDVDQADFDIFRLCMSGPNVPADPDCEP